MSSDSVSRRNVAVIAPHPDDETFGCGGTMLRLKDEHPRIGLHWIIATVGTTEQGYDKQALKRREREIDQVAKAFRFADVHRLKLPTAELDRFPAKHIIELLRPVIKKIAPNEMYLPYAHDIHTDHGAVFRAAQGFSKWFRFPSIRRVIAYETPSETEFAIDPDARGFRPNRFVDISNYLERKLEIMEIYASELGKFPFPRSRRAVESLARWRGSTAGVDAAEAFMVLKELV